MHTNIRKQRGTKKKGEGSLGAQSPKSVKCVVFWPQRKPPPLGQIPQYAPVRNKEVCTELKFDEY